MFLIKLFFSLLISIFLVLPSARTKQFQKFENYLKSEGVDNPFAPSFLFIVAMEILFFIHWIPYSTAVILILGNFFFFASDTAKKY